jgi:esterase/lipase
MHWMHHFFSKPSKGNYKNLQKPTFLKEAKLDLEFLKDHQIPLYQWGKGTHKVLLVHGWNSNAARWQPLIQKLFDHNFEVYALEAPAHGMSSEKYFSVPKYEQFIHKVYEKVQPNYMIGHSIGATAVLYWCHLHPNHQLHKVGLLGAPSDMRVLLDNYYQILQASPKMRQAFDAFIEEKFEVMINQFTGASFAEKLSIPVFQAHDTLDEVVSFAEAEKIYQQIMNNTQFYLTNSSGHSMHSNEMYYELINFLKC